jgi:hypothetical protein
LTESDFRQRLYAAGIEKAELDTRAARAVAEREEMHREFVFELAAKELGRETAMRILNRIRLLDVGEQIEKAKGVTKP